MTPKRNRQWQAAQPLPGRMEQCISDCGSRRALAPTLVFTLIGISLADTISLEVFNKILLVVFFLMELRLITDVI